MSKPNMGLRIAWINCTIRVLPNLVLDTTGKVVDSINGNTKRRNIVKS